MFLIGLGEMVIAKPNEPEASATAQHPSRTLPARRVIFDTFLEVRKS